MRYDAVILDMDGVLVSHPPSTVFRRAIDETFHELGIEDVSRQHRETLRRYVDLTVEDVERVCAEYGIDTEEFWSIRQRNVAEAQLEAFRRGRTTPFRDCPSIKELEADLAIVSNNQHTTVTGIVRSLALESHLETWFGIGTTLTDMERRKPDPHYVERAIDELDATRTLFVGDNERDVVAARRAGVDSAYIRRSHNCEYELGIEPTYEIDSLRAVQTLVDA